MATTRRMVLAVGGLVVVALLMAAVRVLGAGTRARAQEFEVAQVERGTFEQTISATGTLQAVGTVQVGTQVTGTIREILVDYNDQVRKGQVLAVLDTTMLAAAVRDAQAGLMRAQAEYDRASEEFRRDEELYARNFISYTQYLSSKVTMQIAKAALLSAQAALDRATANLRYAVITSPIDGTVIQRNNEPGQTVAASLQAPTLFLIAEDLSHMEILAAVDETDIGLIRQGMPARFGVEAYPEMRFQGVVKQVRLQPEVVQNVVMYTVVVDAPNPQRILLPGMTASVEFIVDRLEDTLLVTQRALKFEPPPAMVQHLRGFGRPEGRVGGRLRQGPMPPLGPGTPAATRNPDVGTLWVLADGGQLRVALVRKGPSDGSKTVIAPLTPPDRPGPWAEVREGTRVVVGMKANSQGRTTRSTGAFAQPFGPPPR